MTKTIYDQFELVAATKDQWRSFSDFHYRPGKLYFTDRLFALRHISSGQLAAIVVYCFANANNQTRNKVLAQLQPHTIENDMRLQLANYDIRTISRLVVWPSFRGIGLGSELLRRSMPLLDVRFVEAIAVMAKFSPVFVRAGLKQYEVKPNRHIKTAHRFMLRYNLKPELSTDQMAQTILELSSATQALALVTLYNFACHYSRALRSHTPGSACIKEYLNIMKLQLNLSPAYFLGLNHAYSKI